MKRRLNYLISFVVFFLFFSQLHADVSVNTIKLKKTKPGDSFFEGKVISPRSEIFDFDVTGKLIYIKHPGEYVCSPIIKDNGEVIRKGTIIASLSKKRYSYNVNTQSMNIEIANSELKAAKANLGRAKKLIKSKAISQREFENYNAEYIKAKLNLSQSLIELKKLKNQLKSCDMVAPFSGIVEEIYAAPGNWIESDNKVIKISRINPLIIKLSFPEEIVRIFTKEDVIKIYPLFSDKPVPAWTDKSLIDGSIYAFVVNSLVFDRTLNKAQESLKKVTSLFPVARLTSETKEIMGLENINNPFGDSVPLAVPVQAVKKDSRGTYVMRVKGACSFDINKGVPEEFNVEKIYVELGDITRQFFLGRGYTLKVKSLSKTGKLNFRDIVVLASKPNVLKDGERVVYGKYIWRFYPGQTVKVEISSLTPEAYYVPKNVVMDKGVSEKYIYAVENNKMKTVNVNIIGMHDDYYAVDGKGLQDGLPVIVMDNKEDYKHFYEDCPVTTNTNKINR